MKLNLLHLMKLNQIHHINNYQTRMKPYSVSFLSSSRHWKHKQTQQDKHSTKFQLFSLHLMEGNSNFSKYLTFYDMTRWYYHNFASPSVYQIICFEYVSRILCWRHFHLHPVRSVVAISPSNCAIRINSFLWHVNLP